MSRQLFERWCEDERSGVVIAGYSVEGTLAKKLLSEPEEITCLDGRIKKRKCSIEYISFSAHVDYIQNSKFIRSVVPDSILLVHGEPVEMGRLKVELDKDIARSWPDPTHVPRVEMPENGQTVRLEFAKPIVAEVVGTAADEMLHDMDLVESGAGDDIHFPEDAILVSENFKSKVVTAKDLAAFTPCRLGRIQQRVVIPLPAVVLQLRAHNNMTARLMLQSHLEEVFDDVSLTIHKNPSEKNTTSTTTAAGGTTSPTKESWTTLLVQQILTVEENVENDFITVAWSASPVNDVVADCALGIIYQALSTTHFLRSTWKESSVRSTHAHSHTKAEADNVSSLHSSSPTLSSCKKHDHSSVVNSDHTEEDAIVKRMKLGLVDPSRSFRAPGNRLLDS
ncbi:Cpsf3, partial [Symbiodinium microadriaticum]